MMQLMGGAGGVTGNPLLDMYTQQYAAALGYPAAAGQSAGGVAVSGAQGMQIQPSVSQSLSLDQAQAQAQAQAVAG